MAREAMVKLLHRINISVNLKLFSNMITVLDEGMECGITHVILAEEIKSLS